MTVTTVNSYRYYRMANGRDSLDRTIGLQAPSPLSCGAIWHAKGLNEKGFS
ncbi:hypothetical protein CCOS191_4089 [Pseudomonas sp. CCOS 191]|nr:hypothetical protein CCOS191_4089 [Pseudomonas sp. CCOS 191]